ncbi:putative amidohydrolase YtcJ [Actinoplanes lutulentus]|uniref:Uncharacterized protein n=1 Tax=Actinoplanes lutulentus TaxID=1287878 RepID=A0A327ZIS9_9ACTN|nr:hypothetical protein [Actinoplanes lutulentus]MBB2947313.1 putative amidohydrolase YtcJ [Actinoplanes lutulentus]RAK36588.1 hypothetical protein B0I29_108178 [Actinoplanes lutulentus]
MARGTNGFRDTRPHLAHLQVVHPDDIARFRQLGAAAHMRPLWAAYEPQMDQLTIPFLGAATATASVPVTSLTWWFWTATRAAARHRTSPRRRSP